MKKLPKIILFIILSLSYITQIYAYSDFKSTDEIFELYSDKNTEYNILIFFNGVGTGISWANSILEFENKERLYCPPGDLSFSAKDYFKMYRTEYFRIKEIYDSMDMQPPAYLVLKGLQTKYPCN